MSGMRRVCVGVVQHRVKRSHKRRHSGKSRKDRAIPNFAVEHEGGPLRYLQQMKISSVRADTRFNNG
jgi:hypothetical protein